MYLSQKMHFMQYKTNVTNTLTTVGHPFLRATNFANGAKSNFVEIILRNDIGSVLYNTHEHTQDGVFGETNFMEVPKICEIHEIYGPRKRVLYSS